MLSNFFYFAKQFFYVAKQFFDFAKDFFTLLIMIIIIVIINFYPFSDWWSCNVNTVDTTANQNAGVPRKISLNGLFEIIQGVPFIRVKVSDNRAHLRVN